MKRDARIGLAVVLVLGLGVTLLIGRALYKHGGTTADADNDGLVIEGTDTKQAGKADPANANSFGSDTAANGVAAQPSPNVPPGTQNFINEQTNPIQQQGGRTLFGTPIHGGGTDVQQAPQPNVIGGHTAPSGNEYYAYTAVNGDSPWSISSKVYGDGKYTQKIVEANDLTSKKIKPGMILRIPSIANKPTILKLQPYNEPGVAHGGHDAPATKPAPANTTAEIHGGAVAAKGTYKVETGDTLSTIAKKHYGSNGPKTIQLIVAANHGLDPAKLRVGQELALPAVK